MEVKVIPKVSLPPLTCGMLAEADFEGSWGGTVHTQQRLRVNAIFDVSNVGRTCTLHVFTLALV